MPSRPSPRDEARSGDQPEAGIGSADQDPAVAHSTSLPEALQGMAPQPPRDPLSPPLSSPATLPLPQPELALDPDRDLAYVAVGASNLLLLGSLVTLILGLFPLRLADSQWQLNLMASLAANGTWMLVGLVLLHLAVRHQPSKGRWLLRLAFLRRLMPAITLIYLLLVPLQLAVTWQALETSRSNSDQTLRGTIARVQVLKRVIGTARNLEDLKIRVKAIPGAPPIPQEAATLPFETLRRTLLGQLDAVSSSVREQIAARDRSGIAGSLWRQSARNAFTNLLLAFAFASVNRGSKNSASLISVLLSLPRRVRRLPRQIRRLPKLLAPKTTESDESLARGGVPRRRRRRSASGRPSRSGSDAATPTSAAPPAPEPPGRFAQRWQRWKRRLMEDP